MRIGELHYDLPPELIARTPAEQRDASRLLVLDRAGDTLGHARFSQLPDLLPPGAVLVMNDTRVLPARMQLRRASGGRLEGLFIREREPGLWEVMMTGAGRVKPREALQLWRDDAPDRGEAAGNENAAGPEDEIDAPEADDAGEQRLVLIERLEGGTWLVRPSPAGGPVEILERWGSPPLPPYILRAREAQSDDPLGVGTEAEPVARDGAKQSMEPHIQEASGADDLERYQTVYARQPGAVAAPTAGLHFTPELLAELRARGFEIHFVTLHVGVGTFAPIRVDDLRDHVMHEEWYSCSSQTAAAVNAARAAGRPIVAVGTTSVRVLETCARPDGQIEPGAGWTRIFIYPPYQFRVVDAMITNFHLPESTLLAMIFAFAGRQRVLSAYEQAIRDRYRFFSYGDAMLLL